MNNRWAHIFPGADIIVHNLDYSSCECECNPDIDHELRVVTHQALDGRPKFGPGPKVEIPAGDDLFRPKDWWV